MATYSKGRPREVGSHRDLPRPPGEYRIKNTESRKVEYARISNDRVHRVPLEAVTARGRIARPLT
jgi:hypothetical protein